MDIVIKNGLVIDPENKIYSKLNIGIHNGKITAVSQDDLHGNEVIDAKSMIVTPGFIDGHMHEDEYDIDKDEFSISIFDCMLRMGVTTAIGGNCGDGPSRPDLYIDAVDRKGLPVNFGLLVPHNGLRRLVGENDKYKKASKKNIEKMRNITEEYLDKGCLGISFGIRYVPGIDMEELLTVSEALKKDRKIVAAHIRDDAKQVIPSAMELINVGINLEVPVQVSHIGSMGAYGQMESLLTLIDNYKAMGLDISSDCYPYSAFSTSLGETTYDDGFLSRYETTYESIEIGEDEYRGKRLNEELFFKLRKERPELITIGHVMKDEEIDMAIAHPAVLIASDGFMHNFQGHPRASGTFPRVINKYVKEKKLISLYDAIEKMTYLTAKRYGLRNKGGLSVGKDADIVIFNFDEICDNATFENPSLPPNGIKFVIVNGKVAVKDNEILNRNLGKSIRR
ncbi:amidohydrolase family protein [Tissierella sp. MSJ-40]|uniref:Amidohydrolase family protein n=1 Tax=Tissierella simiarum TaxID=2841534 RepID=A0ABS6E925_9FIRM|nr:amidohydrolase family protein [Tissierella simiarum]MBU5439428.1 amidohydrolase family protein [Tissierella simiarum]